MTEMDDPMETENSVVESEQGGTKEPTDTSEIANSPRTKGSEDDGEIEEEEVQEDEGVTNEVEKEKKDDDDLEEGECSSDDEPPPAPEPVIEEVKEEKRRSEKDRKNKRRTRSRSRDRHKRSKRNRERKEMELKLSEEEKKKRDVLRKLKALEENMGLDWEEEEDEDASEESSSSSSDSRSRSRSRSRSHSRSPSRKRDREKRKRDREERHERKKKRRHDKDRKSKSDVCQLFMQGKCQKSERECIFSHDAEPPQVWELCKFYLRDRCAKRDKCLYLHKGFPCKYFHTGRECGEDKESCKFSHEPLNDMTRTLLLKHLETAPKDILGDFPRMTKTEAANTIFQTEAKNKGWITEGPDAVRPPAVEADEKMETEEDQDSVNAPSHIKLDPIQEKLLKAAGQLGGLAGGKWNQTKPGDQEMTQAPPLAVQQALAMVGNNQGFEGGIGGIQSHGVRNNGAFNQGPSASGRRQTVGLLGAAPESHWSGSPFGVGGFKKQLPGLMDVKINEEESQIYLIKQRIVAAKVHEEFNEDSDGDDGGGTGGDETPEVTPPNSRSPTPENNLPPNLPIAQMKLRQRIQQNQLKQRNTSEANEEHEPESFNPNNENQSGGPSSENNFGSPFTLNNLNLPSSLTNMLTAIQHGANSSPGQTAETTAKPDRRQDPRRNKNDPRRNVQQRETEEELERKKDERIMDLDLGSYFGDLELPPLTVTPEKNEEEKSFADAMGLPFKPHIVHEVAKEIDASYGSHSPIDWILKPVSCPKPDYSDIKHLFSNAQLEADPRLRKFAKSGMAKLKELPLPSFPAPKTDPRLTKKLEAQEASNKVVDRRRSSEDSEGSNVYNPAKELSKAKKQQQQFHEPPQQQNQQNENDDAAYSPGQEYYNPGYENEKDTKKIEVQGNEYDQMEEDYGYEDDQQMDYGYPPPQMHPGNGPRPPFPPFDHPSNFPPAGWDSHDPRYPPPQGRGYPPRGPPRGPPMDPYYQGPPGQFGPPRGKFNGPRNSGPRRGGNFNNQNHNRGGMNRKKDPRKRQ